MYFVCLIFPFSDFESYLTIIGIDICKKREHFCGIYYCRPPKIVALCQIYFCVLGANQH